MASPAEFVAAGLAKHGEVVQATPLDEHLVEVQRKQYPSFTLGVVSLSRVTAESIQGVAQDQRVDFVCNVPREAVWTGSAIDLVQAHGKAWGGVADLYSAAAREEPARSFVRREFAFIERIFAQHTAVAHVERLYDRVYRLHRGAMQLYQRP